MTTPDKEEMPTEDRTAPLAIVVREPLCESEREWLEDDDRFFDDGWEEKLTVEVPHCSSEKRLIAEVGGELGSITIEVPGAFGDAPEALAHFIVTACNAYEPMREALSKIANCGQSQEPDHWQFRVMARDTSNAALSTLPVNDRHHSGSDNERLREALQNLVDCLYDQALIGQLDDAVGASVLDVTRLVYLLSARNAAGAALKGDIKPWAFQDHVKPWMQQCFGREIAADTVERNHRFLEEALELVQALGCSKAEAMQLVDYVYDRPVGEPKPKNSPLPEQPASDKSGEGK